MLERTRVEREILDRASRPDFDRWHDQMNRCGACARPVRLRGRIIEQRRGGDRIAYTTAGEPDGVLLIRCGNRRAAVCPSCSFEYAGDVWHLIYAGIAGDHKGVSASVAEHPMVFTTLAGGSFGAVHTTPDEKRGRRSRCRPRRRKTLCRHGRPTWCTAVHHEDDPRLGEPLCLDCYDHAGAVLFNWYAPELWRRFTIHLRRVLARRLGVPASKLRDRLVVGYAKVAEFQRRGLVHFHAIIRLDGTAGDDAPWPAPEGVTAADLEDAVREAARHVAVHVPAWREDRPGLVLRFGEHGVNVQPIRRPDLDHGDISAEKVAGYVAKYATKAAEDLGLGERIPDLYHARFRQLSPHVRRMVETAWQLGEHETFAGIRRWLHMLGFRGHFATKSRRHSTTLGAIRGERREYRRRQAAELRQLDDTGRGDDPDGDDSTLVISRWEFAGLGYLTAGDAVLAASAAARARERREAARDARRSNVA